MIEDRPYGVINSVPMTEFAGVGGAKLYLVHTMPEWKAFYELLMTKKLVACDTETTGFHYFKDHEIVGMSFGWRDTHFYVPVRHVDSITGGEQPSQLCMDDIREDLRVFFAQEDLTTIWHNWKFDAHFFRREGIEILGAFHDTRILWLFHDENAPGKLKQIASGWTDDMKRRHKGVVGPEAAAKEKEISKWRTLESRELRKAFTAEVRATAIELRSEPKYQGMGLRDLKKLVKNTLFADHPMNGVSKEDVHYGMVPVELMCEYAGMDTFITWSVYEYTMQRLNWTKGLKSLYVTEISLSRVLLEAEERGVRIDKDYLEALSKEFGKKIEKYRTKVFEVLGEFNLNSPPQMVAALQNHGVTLVKKTDSGAFCVDKGVLEKNQDEFPVIKDILKLRMYDKLKGTYADSICAKLVDEDILHCSFNQNVTTGRMSSTDPNLQNIPGRDTSIRKAFIAPEKDFTYIFCDYSQIEVRLTAHYSQDPLLLDAYHKGQDVHTRTMCEMFNHDYDEAIEVLHKEDKQDPRFKLFKDLRNVAKRINFGIIYGVGAPGLSEQISRPDMYADLSPKAWVAVCQTFIDTYLDKYIGVKRMINRLKREVRKEHEITNGFGRIRHLPWIKATKILKDTSYYWLEGRAERQAVNFLIQGEAADLFKKAAVRVHKLLESHKSYIVNFVHDEIQIYLHKDEHHLLTEIKREMEDFEYLVPIIADFEYTTDNWANKRSI